MEIKEEEGAWTSSRFGFRMSAYCQTKRLRVTWEAGLAIGKKRKELERLGKASPSRWTGSGEKYGWSEVNQLLGANWKGGRPVKSEKTAFWREKLKEGTKLRCTAGAPGKRKYTSLGKKRRLDPKET